VEVEPGFLDGIIRLAQGAQHPVGDRLQVRPVAVELRRQPAFFFHSVTFLRRVPSSR
jgi:hypothetical protein